ncbi:hypothetical protein EP7_000395 [Isosphaeraceae bacterium EP7]
MLRFAGCACLLAFAIASSAAPARAQYNYPRGYSGWNGWGGGTVGGSHAAGMGAFAAGAGSYNEQTSQARAQNANTAMQVNQYTYAVKQRNMQNYENRQKEKVANAKSSTDTIYSRIHDHPEPHDIRNGDALNVVLDELVNPDAYTQVSQRATQPVASGLVKNIEFEFAPQMVVISLDDLSSRGVPDALLTNPSFQTDRTALRTLVQKAHEESATPGGQVSPETLANLRVAIKTLKAKVDSTLRAGTADREQADNFLKGLYGLTKMLQSPDIAAFLKGLNDQPTTTMGHLITFMHSFNLRFGPSKTSDQGNAYDQLYPMLVALRDGAGVPHQGPTGSPPPMQSPSKVTNFFSGMDYSHFDPQANPHAPAPAPPAPNN